MVEMKTDTKQEFNLGVNATERMNQIQKVTGRINFNRLPKIQVIQVH